MFSERSLLEEDQRIFLKIVVMLVKIGFFKSLLIKGNTEKGL